MNNQQRRSKTEELDDQVRDLAARAKLAGWNEFVRTVEPPADLMPALLTGRPELISLMQPRALDADEAAKVFRLLATVIETNMALREHAEQIAILVRNWKSAFTQLHSVGDQIERFANFETVET